MDIGRLQPLFIICAAIVGILIGSTVSLGEWSVGLIELFLMMLLYILFLSVDLQQIGRSFRNIRFTATAVSLNFVLTPILSFALGALFFSDSMDLRIGLMMLLVTPCTDWYLVFTGLSKGNVELGMSILPLNLVLQIVLLPVYLFMFLGNEVRFDTASMVLDMVLVLIIPFTLSCLTKLTVGRRLPLDDALQRHGDNLQLLFLCLAVTVMFVSEGGSLLENPGLLLKMFVPLILFFILLFTVSQAIGRLLGFQRGDSVALTFTSLARNSPLSLAIAIAAFPDQPLISLALVIGPLIELPILSLISWVLNRMPYNGTRPGDIGTRYEQEGP